MAPLIAERRARRDQLIVQLIADLRFHITDQGVIWREASGRGRHHKKSDYEHWLCGEIMIPCGYMSISYCSTRLLSHRIVYASKVGLLDPNKEINHKNGIKRDNRPENLELVTGSENMFHAYRVGLCHQKLGNKFFDKMRRVMRPSLS